MEKLRELRKCLKIWSKDKFTDIDLKLQKAYKQITVWDEISELRDLIEDEK